uniref:L-asparaginase N-terminal domain-containing protein n=1 Tax=Ditylenchus dipsaci TaxID=166011 RepID=A0A915ES18_9BILA
MSQHLAPSQSSGKNSSVTQEQEVENQQNSFYYYSWSADGSEKIRRMSIESDLLAKPVCHNSMQVEDVPSSSVHHHITPIDETHTPKQLTTLVTDKLVKKFSGTHLAELQTEICSSAGGLGAIAETNKPPLPSPKYGALKESKVLVLYTGGTIGMKCNSGGMSGVYSPQQHYLPRAIRELPPLNDKEYVEQNYADVQVKPYALPPLRGMKKRVVYWLVEYEPLLDSSDMTFDDWIRIAKDIHKSYSAYDGFVVLHGTDTLAYTACALSFMMQNLGKPVVVTGAQIPVAEVRSDGRENFIGP